MIIEKLDLIFSEFIGLTGFNLLLVLLFVLLIFIVLKRK